jgi:hypothetical protein
LSTVRAKRITPGHAIKFWSDNREFESKNKLHVPSKHVERFVEIYGPAFDEEDYFFDDYTEVRQYISGTRRIPLDVFIRKRAIQLTDDEDSESEDGEDNDYVGQLPDCSNRSYKISC